MCSLGVCWDSASTNSIPQLQAIYKPRQSAEFRNAEIKMESGTLLKPQRKMQNSISIGGKSNNVKD